MFNGLPENKKQWELRMEFEAYLNQIFTKAAAEFTIKPSNHVNEYLARKFELFATNENPTLLKCWKVSDATNQFHICCIAIDSTIHGGKRTSSETQTHFFLYGFIETKTDFGISLIQREGIVAKFIDLFTKQDIDFKEHKIFSSKYLCFSQHEDVFRKAMKPALMDFLSTVNHLELEFRNHHCLFKTQKSIIDQKSNLELFKIGLKLQKLLS